MQKLNMFAPMGTTGYGIASQYLFKELMKDFDITLYPRGGVVLCTNHETHQATLAAVDKRYTSFDAKAPCFNIWHQNDLLTRLGTGPYVAYSFFELDPLNKRDILHMRIPDIMCTSSRWAADIAERGTGREVKVLPCGVDVDVFKPVEKPHTDTYTFFNIGKWEKRKGHDILCTAFNKAFERKDNVRLVMMPHNPFLTPKQLEQWVGFYTNSKLSSKISIVTKQFESHADVAAQINTFDCGVFPARSEGWNLELLESMACGKPVITTNVSAHTEYCTKDNAFLIEAPNVEEAFDGTFFFGGGNWAELDYEEEEQLVEHMRYCYQNRPTNDAGLLTAKQFTWENAGKIAKEIISSALDK